MIGNKTAKYIHALPSSTSFTGKGLHGYTFGPLRDRDVEIYYIVVEKGHDTFMISKNITRIYYVLDGEGFFTIEDDRYDVAAGMLVEVPPRLEYSYSGKMTMLGFSKPRWFSGNDTMTKWNPDVVEWTSRFGGKERRSWLSRLAGIKIRGKSPTRAYLGLNDQLWTKLPPSVTGSKLFRLYGQFLHSLAREHGNRQQAFATFFLRNRPELELIRRLMKTKRAGEKVRVAVVASSTGAEVYSVMWSIRSTRTDLQVSLHAIDIAPEAVEFAKRGVYQAANIELAGTPICERMTREELGDFFDGNDGELTVKPWIRNGISWCVLDAREADLLQALGPQDVVFANNFLCHMDSYDAELCLRNVARLVSPGGYLVVAGVDLDVRTNVTADLDFLPVEELLEEIHEGDPCMRRYWPCYYAGLEPLDKQRGDWKRRYAAVFQAPRTAAGNKVLNAEENVGA